MAGALVFGLGALEWGLRALWLETFSIAAGARDPHFHHRPPGNRDQRHRTSEYDLTIRTNRYGLRGPDPVIPKPAGAARLLMLGDSFTFGFYVNDDETFSRLIEHGLAKKSKRGRRVEVINAGVPSYSPILEYLSLRDQFLQFEPDAVILWYDLGDLQDDYRHGRNAVFDRDGRLVRCDPYYTDGRFNPWSWFTERSAIGQYIEMKVLNPIDNFRVLGLGGYLAAKRSGVRTKLAVSRALLDRQAPDLLDYERFLLARQAAPRALLERYWALSGRYISLIHQLLTARGIPFAVGFYPYGMLVARDEWSDGRGYWGFEKETLYEGSEGLAVLTAFCEREGIPLINSLESFRRAAAGSEPLFLSRDGHFTAAGNRVLAAHTLADPAFRALLAEIPVARPAGLGENSP